MAEEKTPFRFFRGTIILFSLLAGLALAPLLPVGIFVGLGDPLFDYFALAHFILLLAAVLTSLVFFITVALQAERYRVLITFTAIIFLVFIACHTLTPIVSRDALIHHLAVPKWWVEAGAITQIKWHEWSYYPMLVNLGYTALLKYKLEFLCPLYHMCYLVLLAGVVSLFTHRTTNDALVSALAFLITVTLPINIRLASGPVVDLGLALYAGIAITAFANWGSHGLKRRDLVVAGIALGLALSCKYNAMLFAVMFFPTALVFGIRSGATPGRVCRALVVVGVFAFLMYLPWVAKNVWWTSNPVYPLYKGWFGAVSSGVKIPTLKPLEQRFFLYHESWVDIVTMPLRMILLGTDHSAKFYDGVLSPILFLAVFPLFRLRNAGWKLYFYLLCVLYFSFATVLAAARIRYHAPIFAPVLILTACGLQQCLQFFDGKYKDTILSVLFVVHVMFALGYCYVFEQSRQTFPYLLSSSGDAAHTRTEYLRRYIPEYGMIEYINQNIPEGETVYLLYTGNRFYYYERPVFSGGHFSANPLIKMISSAGSAEALAEDLDRRGRRYLMAHLGRTKEGFDSLLKDSDRIIWNELIAQHMTPVHAEGEYGLWRVKETAVAPEEAEAADVDETGEVLPDSELPPEVVPEALPDTVSSERLY